MNRISKIAKLIDHTLLSPDATATGIVKLCDEAAEHRFHSVCVNPSFIETARDSLEGSSVCISATVGFPLGVTLSAVKIDEAIRSVMLGADELDIVINIGHAKSGRWDMVGKEISDIVTATPSVVHKIIVETCYLSDEEKKRVTEVVIGSGAEMIKTSTGFGPAGADINDVKLIKSITENRIGIKAAGGIRTLNDLEHFVKEGATRIGTSSGVNIIKEAIER